MGSGFRVGFEDLLLVKGLQGAGQSFRMSRFSGFWEASGLWGFEFSGLGMDAEKGPQSLGRGCTWAPAIPRIPMARAAHERE